MRIDFANQSRVAAVNRGIDLASGDPIGWLDPGQYFLPGALSKLCEAAAGHPEAEVVYPCSRASEPGGGPTGELRNLEHDFIDALRWGILDRVEQLREEIGILDRFFGLSDLSDRARTVRSEAYSL